MKKISNRGSSEVMIAFEGEKDKRIHGRKWRFDMTVMSRLPRESRVARSVIIVLVPRGTIKGLVVPGRTKRHCQ